MLLHFVILDFIFEQRCEKLASAIFVDIGSGVIVVIRDDIGEFLFNSFFFELIIRISEG